MLSDIDRDRDRCAIFERNLMEPIKEMEGAFRWELVARQFHDPGVTLVFGEAGKGDSGSRATVDIQWGDKTKPRPAPAPAPAKIKSYRIGALRNDPEMRSLLAGKLVVVWRKWTGNDDTEYKVYYTEFGDATTNDASQMTVFTWNVLWQMISQGEWSDDDLVVPVKWVQVPTPEEVE